MNLGHIGRFLVKVDEKVRGAYSRALLGILLLLLGVYVLNDGLLQIVFAPQGGVEGILRLHNITYSVVPVIHYFRIPAWMFYGFGGLEALIGALFTLIGIMLLFNSYRAIKEKR